MSEQDVAVQQALYSCSDETCRVECSYPADMLRVWRGKPWCAGCFAENRDCIHPPFDWGGLPPFVTPEQRSIKALQKDNARLRGALEQIRDGAGMLNQPAALNGPEEDWLRQRIWEYERIAHTAINTDNHKADPCGTAGD